MPKITPVEGNSQRLDGGAMFGNAPRPLWERWAKPDGLGRIALCTRGMLVEVAGRRVLLETGIGAYLGPEARVRYGVLESAHVLLHSLRAAGVTPAEVDVVVLSHLHFDHAGGLLSAHDPRSEPQLVFPNAGYVVGTRAFERACHPHLRDRASFIEGLAERLEATGRLHLVDGPRCELLGDHFELSTSDGHTPGMLHTTVRGHTGAGIFFAADLIPGVPWVHAPITMGYDRCAEQLVDEKLALLQRAVEEDLQLFFTHDPQVCAARVQRDERGRYGIREPRAPRCQSWYID